MAKATPATKQDPDVRAITEAFRRSIRAEAIPDAFCDHYIQLQEIATTADDLTRMLSSRRKDRDHWIGIYRRQLVTQLKAAGVRA